VHGYRVSKTAVAMVKTGVYLGESYAIIAEKLMLGEI
jgi:hypothetical protein